MPAYATGSDLVARYDIDIVGDLASDERDPMERSSIPTNPKVETALLDGAGEIEIALLEGGRYTVSQLTNLTGNSRQKLIRINCDIAMALLLQRRVDKRFQELAEQVAKISRCHLQALCKGENVFGLPENIDAGVLDVDTITAIDIDNRNLLPARMERFFPTSQQRAPNWRD